LREIVNVVLSRRVGSPPLTLVVTSPDPGEGKTAITVSMGFMLADAGCRTLLVDGDMRRPNLHRAFHMKSYRGLTDLLHSEEVTDLDLSRCVQPTHVPDLYLLAGGTAVATGDSLLLRPQIDHLLTKVERWFPVVLIDTPPSLQVLDARLFAKRVNGVLLVLRPGLTTPARATEARQTFERDGSAVLGIVLNEDTHAGSPT
jgi:capsular exopolysaccharide synthesis family protein